MKTYKCYVCRLHYDNREIAKECEKFCKKYGACSVKNHQSETGVMGFGSPYTSNYGLMWHVLVFDR